MVPGELCESWLLFALGVMASMWVVGTELVSVIPL